LEFASSVGLKSWFYSRSLDWFYKKFVGFQSLLKHLRSTCMQYVLSWPQTFSPKHNNILVHIVLIWIVLSIIVQFHWMLAAGYDSFAAISLHLFLPVLSMKRLKNNSLANYGQGAHAWAQQQINLGGKVILQADYAKQVCPRLVRFSEVYV